MTDTRMKMTGKKIEKRKNPRGYMDKVTLSTRENKYMFFFVVFTFLSSWGRKMEWSEDR